MNYEEIAPLKLRKFCDWSCCPLKSEWYAHLDDLVFCWLHADQWKRDSVGYEYPVQDLAISGKILR